MKKSETIAAWRALPPDQDPLEHMTPIPYKATGSRYGACGIRIDGNPAFIDAVLSRLQPLLDGENQVTRLELARSEVKPTEINGERRTFDLADQGGEVCYIRLHVRGHEGAMVAGLLGQHAEATVRFAQTNVYAREEK
jgi:hypothetical protein